MRSTILLLCALFLLFAGGSVSAQPVEAQPEPPRVHNAWKTPEGGTRLLLKNEKAGGLSGYAVAPTGRKSWELSGRVLVDGRLDLTRFVPKSEWSTAPEAVKDAAIQHLGGSRKPGFIESPMQLSLSAEGKSLGGTYSREEIRYSDTELVDVVRHTESLQFVQISDLLEALMWTAIAMGLIGGLLSIGLDFIPVIGDIKGLAESLTGRDAVTGDELAGWERALGALPLAGGALTTGAALARLARRGGPLADMLADILRRVRSGERVLDSASDLGRRADDVGAAGRHSDELAGAARRGDDAADAVRHGDEAADAGRHADDAYPPMTPGCFVAGTLVLCADGSHRPIDRLEPGDLVMAVPGGDLKPSQAEPVARAVVSIRRQTAARLVRLEIADGKETSFITCTPRHPIATRNRYVAAEELEAGTRILRAGSGAPKVLAVERLDQSNEVFNLTVEADHCFFVSALSLLVHNHSEWTTQQQMERYYDKHPEYKAVHHYLDGRPVREPGYKDGKFTGFGRLDEKNPRPGMKRGEARLREQAGAFGIDTKGYKKEDFDDRAFAEQTWRDMGRDPKTLGEPPTFQQLDELQGHQRSRIDKELNSARSGMTYPDDVRRWTDPNTGATHDLAIEHKTAQKGVYEHFTEFEGDITNEVWNRRKMMPNHKHELVVDLRNTGQTPQSAMADLQRIADERNAVGMENVGDYFDQVRFVEGGADTPKLTDVFHFTPKAGG